MKIGDKVKTKRFEINWQEPRITERNPEGWVIAVGETTTTVEFHRDGYRTTVQFSNSADQLERVCDMCCGVGYVYTHGSEREPDPSRRSRGPCPLCTPTK